MELANEHVTTLQDFGYTEPEARFLYLVATHSGYFTARQYIDFRKQPKGWYVSELTRKILEKGHARITVCARNTYLFNVYSRNLYGVIGRENSRNRRHHSVDLIRRRLHILDFMIAHPDFHYLESETDKVRYFHETLGLPLPVLPWRLYRGLQTNVNTKRYFVDRFPVFIPHADNSLSLAPVVTFTYCDFPGSSLAGYFTHLRDYEKLLFRLPEFNFVYASPNSTKFPRAAAAFGRILLAKAPVDLRRLVRYFEVRRLWETNQHRSLTRIDRDAVRDGDQRYCGEPFESIYQNWVAQGLSKGEIEAAVDKSICPSGGRPEWNFQAFALPQRQDLFWAEIKYVRRTWSHERCSGVCSAPRSANSAGNSW